MTRGELDARQTGSSNLVSRRLDIEETAECEVVARNGKTRRSWRRLLHANIKMNPCFLWYKVLLFRFL